MSWSLSPIIFPGSPERWWGDEALKAEAQAAQAPGEERHQAACNILAMRPRSLFRPGFGSRRHPTFRSTPPNEGPAPALALQLHVPFQVCVLCGGLMSAPPSRPRQDEGWLNAPLRQADRYAPDFLDRPGHLQAWR